MDNDWQVTSSCDILFDESYDKIELHNNSLFSLVGSQGEKITISLVSTVKEDKSELQLNKVVDVEIEQVAKIETLLE